MGATNTWVVAVMERIIGNLVLADVIPYLLGGPIHDGVDLHQIKLSIPLNFSRLGPNQGLIAADAGNPGLKFPQLSPQRLNFAQFAAQIGVAVP